MVIVDVLTLCAFHIHSSIERLHHVLFSPAIPMQEVGFQMGLVLWVSVKSSYFNKSITRRLIDPICVDVSTPVTRTHLGWHGSLYQNEESNVVIVYVLPLCTIHIYTVA